MKRFKGFNTRLATDAQINADFLRGEKIIGIGENPRLAARVAFGRTGMTSVGQVRIRGHIMSVSLLGKYRRKSGFLCVLGNNPAFCGSFESNLCNSWQ